LPISKPNQSVKQVEELLLNKPATKPLLAGPVSSFLDFNLPSLNLGGSGGSGANATAAAAAGSSGSPGGGSPKPGGAPGGSGGSPAGMGRFDAFTKKFKETMVDLINTDLSVPYEPGQGSGGRLAGHAAMGGGQTPRRAGTPTPLGPVSASAAAPLQPQAGAAPVAAAGGAAGAGSSPAAAAAAAASASASSSPVPPPASTAPSGAPQPPGAWRLKERMVAIESLMTIANELKAAKGALLAALGPPTAASGTAGGSSGGGGGDGAGNSPATSRGGGGRGAAASPLSPQRQQDKGEAAGGGDCDLAKEVEGYFSRTVDAVQDLKEAIFRGATKQLLQVRVVEGCGWIIVFLMLLFGNHPSHNRPSLSDTTHTHTHSNHPRHGQLTPLSPGHV
jgi:hypothetical protein